MRRRERNKPGRGPGRLHGFGRYLPAALLTLFSAARRMATIRVHTTQNVTLEYETASLGERILAALIDYAILIAWAVGCMLLLGVMVNTRGLLSPMTSSNSKENLFYLLVLLLIFLPYVFYHLACEVFFNGQSLGKKARHIHKGHVMRD